MGDIIDFIRFKSERKEPTESSGRCPHCYAPTSIQRTSAGTEIHTYKGTDMEDYYKVKNFLLEILNRLLEDNTIEDLEECFGDGLKDFLKELNNEGNGSPEPAG